MTLDRTVRLLEAAWEEPRLRLDRAIELVEYHVRRNEVARRSHAKTWGAKHPGVKPLRLMGPTGCSGVSRGGLSEIPP